MQNLEQQHSLSELCVLADVPVRTLRYYIQAGLVDRPEGATKGAKYSGKHLEQLLLIKKWAAAGLSLERIKELLKGEEPNVPVRAKKPGAVEVWSHLYIADGLELVIEPNRAGLTPEQVRTLTKGVMALYESITTTRADSSSNGSPD